MLSILFWTTFSIIWKRHEERANLRSNFLNNFMNTTWTLAFFLAYYVANVTSWSFRLFFMFFKTGLYSGLFSFFSLFHCFPFYFPLLFQMCEPFKIKNHELVLKIFNPFQFLELIFQLFAGLFWKILKMNIFFSIDELISNPQ